jgi:large subunit ribosomal protein L35
MPKMKSHSGCKKRFRVTGSGKIVRFRTGKRHLLRKKTKCAKVRLTGSGLVSKADTPRIKRLMLL